MADIRPFILNHLLEPLKQYPTVIQDTAVEIIIQKLQELYDYSVQFPEIISPDSSRLDILRAIADQFLFTVREDADIQEQIDILDNILYVYNRRGSVDTIENMWKYYGGTLPKDVKVIIPSYNLFRYSMSKLSGTHVFQDNSLNRTGVYEIRLTNNTYPIPDLREFLIKELVAAGNYFYFTNTLHMDVIDSEGTTSNPYVYKVKEHTFIDIEMPILKSTQGLTWSGHNPVSRNSEDSAWSGRGSIYLELLKVFELPFIQCNVCSPYQGLGFFLETTYAPSGLIYTTKARPSYELQVHNLLYYTPSDLSFFMDRHLYNSEGDIVEPTDYKGYFTLARTPLGEEVI